MLTRPFLPQASRQFDQEGRKKFFTLDMNNILREWVGWLLNHSQANCNSLSFFYQLFSLIVSHFPWPPLLLSKCFVFSLSPIVSGNDMLRISVHPALNPLPLPTVLAHPPLQSPISIFYSAFFLFVCFFFSNRLDFLSVSSCRSRSSLLRCAQASIRTWRHLYHATKRPSSSASKSSASTSRWAKLICGGSAKSPDIYWSTIWGENNLSCCSLSGCFLLSKSRSKESLLHLHEHFELLFYYKQNKTKMFRVQTRHGPVWESHVG